MSSSKPIAGLFVGCAFLSSFGLFLLEPMQGKMLLPLFGGSPAVWNTCMVFFQGLLLLGYVFAHFVSTKLAPTKQLIVQAMVLIVPLFFLPIALPALQIEVEWLSTDPMKWLMKALTLTSGAAFFAVSTASPLLQNWYFRIRGDQDSNPYMLYAAGNLGSLTALLAYPLWIEPRLNLGDQSLLWTGVYGVTLALFVAIGVLLYRARANKLPAEPAGVAAPRPLVYEDGFHDSIDEWLLPVRRSPSGYSDGGQRILWVVLAFIPSSLMLGVTAYVTTDVASVPMLWMMPLMLYLLSFVIVFWRYPAWLEKMVGYLMPMLLVTLSLLVFAAYRKHFGITVGLHVLGFFVAALACHGRLYRLRPHPRRLTEFYFWISLGGVLGGAFNTFLAPELFNNVAEYPLVLALAIMAGYLLKDRPGLTIKDWIYVGLTTCLFAGVMGYTRSLYMDQEFEYLAVQLSQLLDKEATRVSLAYGVPLALSLALIKWPLRHGAAVLGMSLAALFYGLGDQVLLRSRNFFGVLTVSEYESQDLHMLVHGGILHGEQVMNDTQRYTPRSYYHRDGPLGQVFEKIAAKRPSMSVAAIGLGTGAIAAYGTPENKITFFEINPAVEQLARDPYLFSYVDDCIKRWCNLKIVIGDGRLKLAESPDAYDLLVVDAFSSDAIPVHLITREALQLYLEHVSEGGILAYHISNRYVNLEPVLLNQAKELGLGYAVRSDEADEATGKGSSTWVILARDEGIYETIVEDGRWRGLMEDPQVGVWADDYANVLRTLNWF